MLQLRDENMTLRDRMTTEGATRKKDAGDVVRCVALVRCLDGCGDAVLHLQDREFEMEELRRVTVGHEEYSAKLAQEVRVTAIDEVLTEPSSACGGKRGSRSSKGSSGSSAKEAGHRTKRPSEERELKYGTQGGARI